MAKMDGKRLGIGTVLGVTAVLIAGGLYGLVNTAVSSENGAPEATTIEGRAPTGAAVGEAVPAADQATAECDFSDWVGKVAADAEAAVKATGRPYRMLSPGSAMTMDYRIDRINVEIDAKQIVTKVFCG